MRELSGSFLGSGSTGEEVLWFFLGSFLLSLDFKFGPLLIELHELGEIELGLLEQLDLLDKDILEWEDLSAFLLDLLANRLRNAKKI